MMTTITYQNFRLLLCLALVATHLSCKKYLEEKPDQKLAVPKSLTELQGLLDNFSVLNQTDAGAGEASSDNYYLDYQDWQAIPYADEQRIYTWEKDNLFALDGRTNEWYCNYQAVYYCNTVLSALNKVPRNVGNQWNWDNIKGQALFFRGQYFLRSLTLWAPAYDPQSSSRDLGIPLRLTDDFNPLSDRASVESSYQQILKDLSESARLLPEKASHPAHPSKPASYGLLARANLSMRKYPQAEAYADSSLNLYNKLMDYNELNVTSDFPFQQFNAEVILWNRILAPGLLAPYIAKIDPELYNSYSSDDLRKQAFFFANSDGSHSFKGYYEQLTAPFGGIAVDEIILTKAESAARNGKLAQAMTSLNELMSKRIKKDKFTAITASSASEALNLILNERRKELLMRDLRWMDIKRLNKEGANIILSRKLGDQILTLPANDPRYALPIPEDVIRLSGIPQNPR